MLPEPLRQGLGRAIRQESHRLAALQIDQDRAIGLAFPQGEIVHPEHGGGGRDGTGSLTEHAQQGVAAYGQSHWWLSRTRRPPQGDGERETWAQPQRPPGPGGSHAATVR